MKDIWQCDGWRVIPTNGDVKTSGLAVMGAGLAKQAAFKYRLLPEKLGEKIKQNGNHLYYFLEYKVITFPTKEHWYEDSKLSLIDRSAKELDGLLNYFDSAELPLKDKVFIPKVGCGLGNQEWNRVRETLVYYLYNHIDSGTVILLED